MKRHSFVWTIYLLLGLFSFALSMVGPMVPSLRDEFHLDYTLAGLHQFTFALGMANVSGIVMSMIVGVLLIVAMVLPKLSSSFAVFRPRAKA